MSYILEALKKSEQERDRERGALPDIKSVHTPTAVLQEDRRSWWPLVLILVLLIAGAAGAFVYLEYFKKQATIAEQETAVASKQTSPEKPPVSKPQPITTITDKAKTASEPRQSEKSAPVEEQKQPSVVFSKQPLQHDDVIGNVEEQRERAAASKSAQAQEEATETESTANVVAISDIPDHVRKNIPGIAFEGHVYSSVPERRSIMINGHKRREGDTIGSDLTVKEITPDGAEFEFQGYRFRLNALQDWSFR